MYDTMTKQSSSDGFYVDEEYVYTVHKGCEIRNKEVKEAVGKALKEVDGILGLRGGLSDFFKKSEDLTRGVTVSYNKEQGAAKVGVKLVTNSMYNQSDIIKDATEKIADIMESECNMRPKKLEIEIVESMTKNEFLQKHGENRQV